MFRDTYETSRKQVSTDVCITQILINRFVEKWRTCQHILQVPKSQHTCSAQAPNQGENEMVAPTIKLKKEKRVFGLITQTDLDSVHLD